ncbi:MAG: ArnT family glycosyltransferase [Anaerolineaceae bacterium]
MNEQPQQKRIASSQSVLLGIGFILSAVEAAAAVWYIFQIPADLKNAVWMGLSAQRLVLIAFLILGMAACLGLAAWCWLKKAKSTAIISRVQTSDWWGRANFPILVASVFAVWILIFMPSYQLGRFQAYFERLQPVLIWLTLGGFQFLLALNLTGGKPANRSTPGRKTWLAPTTWVLGGFLVVWAVMGLTGLGLKPDNVHWNDAGAPLLGGQILIAIILGAVVGEFEKWLILKTGVNRAKIIKKLDIGLMILIWAGAAALWINEPLPHSYFAPGPYPPNYEPYPFSDAAGYDISSQFALIGQGLMNKGYVDKPLFSGLLVFLHLLGGQSYFPVINLQTALVAILPVLLFLIGKKLHSRGVGAAAAFLMIFRELNTIGATLWILSSSSRVMMSEPLTMLGIGFFVFFLVMWGKSPRRDFHWLAAAGGTLGLTTLARHNPWLLIPAGLGFILIVEWRNWRKWLLGSIIFMLAFGAAITPWMIRNQLNNGKPFYFLVAFEGVVLIQRYNSSPIFQKEELTPTQTGIEMTEEGPQSSTPTLVPNAETQKTGTSFTRLVSRIFTFVPAHFFHNLLVSSAIFPTTPIMEDLEHSIKQPGSIWDAAWTGQLGAGNAIMLLIFLLLLAVGVGVSWQRWKWTGILPGLIYLSYNLATAVARTSGARYMQPADWLILFYLAIGLYQLWLWLRSSFTGEVSTSLSESPEAAEKEIQPRNKKSSFPWKSLLAGGIVFCISGLVVLTEWVFPLRYPSITKTELADEIIQANWAPRMNLQPGDLEQFLMNEDTVLLCGRALYPRYYGIGAGEPDRFSAYREQGFPRLVITSIGQEGIQYGVLPLSEPPDYFPNGTDVIMMGCKGDYNIDLAAIILTGQHEVVFTRSPGSPLSCPFPEPVCDDNRLCK